MQNRVSEIRNRRAKKEAALLRGAAGGDSRRSAATWQPQYYNEPFCSPEVGDCHAPDFRRVLAKVLLFFLRAEYNNACYRMYDLKSLCSLAKSASRGSDLK